MADTTHIMSLDDIAEFFRDIAKQETDRELRNIALHPRLAFIEDRLAELLAEAGRSCTRLPPVAGAFADLVAGESKAAMEAAERKENAVDERGYGAYTCFHGQKKACRACGWEPPKVGESEADELRRLLKLALRYVEAFGAVPGGNIDLYRGQDNLARMIRESL